jgi:hypothetical protein
MLTMKNGEPKYNSFETKLRHLKDISLSGEKKERLGSFLSSYIALHPVLETHARVRTLEGRSVFWGMPVRLAAGFAVLVFFLGGGTIAAERALPGDLLYGLKIVNEHVRVNLAPTAEARAHLYAAHIERRLSEAQALVAAGAATEVRTATLVKHFEQSVAGLEKTIADLKADGNPLVAFEMHEMHRSSLRVHGKLLAKMSVEDENALALSERLTPQPVRKDPAVITNERPEPVRPEEIPPLADDEREEKKDIAAFEDVPVEAARGEEGVTAEDPKGEDAAVVATQEVYIAPTAKIGADVFIDTRTLRLYALSRIRDSESLVANSEQVSQSMRRALLDKLGRAFDLYATGALEEVRMNDREARQAFIDSVRVVEDVRTILRMAHDATPESLLLLLLSKVEIRDDAQRVEILNSIIKNLGDGDGLPDGDDVRALLEEKGVNLESMNSKQQ